MLLEYAGGGSLKNYLKEKGKLEESEAKLIITQVINALMYCHSKDLVHRDLKPENVMYMDESKKKIKLIDFGISGIFSEEINAGSYKYLPPEVINGTNIESKPSLDVWSLGCIVYELLVGEKLFKGKNFNEVKVRKLI